MAELDSVVQKTSPIAFSFLGTECKTTKIKRWARVYNHHKNARLCHYYPVYESPKKNQFLGPTRHTNLCRQQAFPQKPVGMCELNKNWEYIRNMKMVVPKESP